MSALQLQKLRISLKAYESNLNSLFEESKNLEKKIKENLNSLKYEE